MRLLRLQWGRRDSETFDSTWLSADKELDEAILVLTREGETVSNFGARRLKEVLSARPAVFGDRDARHFIADERVIALAKAAARKQFGGETIDAELADARAIYTEMTDDEPDSAYGERLFEDTVSFMTASLAAYFDPKDRILNEAQNRRFEILRQAIEDKGGGEADQRALENEIRRMIRKFRRQRVIHDADLVTEAKNFSQRLDTSFSQASPLSLAEAYREVATILARGGDIKGAEEALGKVGNSLDLDPEYARIYILKDKSNDALRLVRDKTDNLSKSILLDAIRQKEGEEASIDYFDQKFTHEDLTAHGKTVVAVRMAGLGRLDDAAELLSFATEAEVEENPAILFFAARFKITSVLPKESAAGFLPSLHLIPNRDELPTDVDGQRKLRSAVTDLERLVGGLGEQDSADFRYMAEALLLCLKLNSLDPRVRESAEIEVRGKLSDPENAFGVVPLAMRYRIDVDWGKINAALGRAKELGGWNDSQLRAAFHIALEHSSPADSCSFIVEHRDALVRADGEEAVASIEIQAHIHAGRIDEANELLIKNAGILIDAELPNLKAKIAAASGKDAVEVWLREFEKTDSDTALVSLADALANARDERLGQYLVLLWERRRQIEDACRACDFFITVGREQEADRFLESLGDSARTDPELHVHLAWSKFRQGDFSSVSRELDSLTSKGLDNANIRRLFVQLAIESGEWARLEVFVQSELSNADQRSATELMSAARLAQAIGSSMAMPLARAAIEKGPDDPALNFAGYELASNIGAERSNEVNAWLAVAMKSADQGGPFQTKSFDEVLEHIKETHEREQKISNMVTKAELPVAMALRPLNSTQSAWFIRQSDANAAEIDSRKKVVIPLFAGNRLLSPQFDPASIALDPIAFLLSSRLGILERVFDAFEDVVLPAGTLHCFFEDYARAVPIQPSRIEQAQDIKGHFSSGLLSVSDDVELQGGADDEDVDREFLALYALARSDDGYVVETPPLRSLNHQIIDHKSYEDRLLSPIGLIRVLQENGIITPIRANAAIEAISGSGGTWANEVSPRAGRPLFLSSLAVQYLSDVGLLTDAAKLFTSLNCTGRVPKLADDEIAAAPTAKQVRDGIENVRKTLSAGIRAGRARVGPWRSEIPTDDEASDDLNRDSTIAPILSAMRNTDGIDAFFCDDRAINKYPKFDEESGRAVPIFTSIDLLLILHRKGSIDDGELARCYEELRRSATGLVPVNPMEIAEAALGSNWAIGPSAELRLLKESILLPIARGVIQLPQERQWLSNSLLNVAIAIRQVWQEIEDIEEAEAAADYLLDVLPDLSQLSSSDSSADRDGWIRETSRNALWIYAGIFDLADERGNAYRAWFEKRIEPRLLRHDPEALDALADGLLSYLREPVE